MDEKMIARINELAKKAKQGTLTPNELQEREQLRKEYLQQFRAGMRTQLEQTRIKYPDGTSQLVKDRRKPQK